MTSMKTAIALAALTVVHTKGSAVRREHSLRLPGSSPTHQDNKGTLYELSAQDIVSCSRKDASCQEGDGASTYAYDWVGRINGGSICTEKSYPYDSKNGAAPYCKRFYWDLFKCEKPELGAYFHKGGRLDRAQIEAAIRKQLVVGRVYAEVGAFKDYTSCVFGMDACANRCIGDATCVGYSYDSLVGVCKLLSSINGDTTSRSGFYAKKITKAESLSECWPTTDNVDFVNNNLQVTVAASAEECCDHCDAVYDSNAFTWSKYNNGMCYLKTQGPVKPVASAPDSDGSAFLRSALKYKCQPLQKDTDIHAVDLSTVLSSTAANCCGICRARLNQGYNALLWTDVNGGTCWLKMASPSSSRPFAKVSVVSAMVF